MEMPDKGYHARVSSWVYPPTALCLSWIVKTSQSFGASRLTRFLHNTRSSASFRISRKLSLSIPLDRPIAPCWPFSWFSPLTLPYKIVLAMVHFVSPPVQTIWTSSSSEWSFCNIVDETEIAFRLYRRTAGVRVRVRLRVRGRLRVRVRVRVCVCKNQQWRIVF